VLENKKEKKAKAKASTHTHTQNLKPKDTMRNPGKENKR